MDANERQNMIRRLERLKVNRLRRFSSPVQNINSDFIVNNGSPRSQENNNVGQSIYHRISMNIVRLGRLRH